MIKRPFIQTAFLSLFGRAGGLIIPFLIAAFYGATVATDAFFLVYGLAIAFMSLFSQMFESAMIPYLATAREVQERCHWFIRRAFTLSWPLFAFTGLLLAWFLSPLLQMTGWSLEGASMVRRIMFGMQPFLWFGLATAAWNALFYHRNIFWFPAVSPLVRACIVMGFIFGTHQLFGIHALTAGLAFGELLRLFFAYRLGQRLARSQTIEYQADRVDHDLLRKFFSDAFWQMAAVLAVHLMVVADQCFAQTTGEGRLTLLSYADRLIQIPYLLFLSGFLNIFHADWSRASAESGANLYTKLRRDLLWIGIGALIAAFFLIALAKPGIQLFYGQAPLTADDRSLLTQLFIWYSLALAPGVLRLALGRVLIVMRCSRFYFVQAWVELGLNICLNALLMRHFGIVGIAMATALVYSLSSVWLYLFIWLRERRGEHV